MNTIYCSKDLKLIEGFVDLNRIEVADKEFFISEFKHNVIIGKSKTRFEQSKEFEDILIGYSQRGEKRKSNAIICITWGFYLIVLAII
jgi:hypothetical protein